ncbi:MAG: GLPGLI family protein [Chitinophagaceae bacterium]
MKAFTFILLACLAVGKAPLHAQNPIFLAEGKIEFERKVNMYSLMDDGDSWNDLQKKTMPKFRTTYFDLLFSKNKTFYQPGRDNPENNKSFYDEGVAQENVVFSELDSSRSTSQKKVFEQIFLIKDSTRQIQWKITDENRVIAGFQCRRANALIMDSIYVVAFYTDEIVSPGGPESFTGLPGMILGISLPHQHVTWFATKVSARPVGAAEIREPTKGKKVTYTSLRESLKEVMKDWGKYKQRNLESVML